MYKILLVLLALSLPLFGENKESEKYISQQTLALSQSNNEFAFDLYHNLETGKNIFFSPYSISSALAMVYDGARGETRKEMGNVLHFDASETTINESFFMLNRIFTNHADVANSDSRLLIVNALWMQNGLHLLPQFLERTAKYFKTSVHRADFQRHPQAARREINYFVKDKTMGKIEDLVGVTDIDESTKMMLISTIYMKGKWQTVFDKSLSEETPFFSDEVGLHSTMMMNQKAFLPYYTSDNFAAVELAYARPNEDFPDLAFLIILPHENFGLAKLETNMNGETFKTILENLENQEVNLFLPKFKFINGFSLKNLLSKMGMSSAFGFEANFEGINGARDLQIGQVIHKAYISIDEAGTEAAAATAVSMNVTAILQKNEAIKFLADHPFMFLIYEKLTGEILFCGRVVKPTL